jgi:hypothetical protein
VKYIASALSIAALSAVIVGTATAQPSDVATVANVQITKRPPHNINPDPFGPTYINPYDPYQNGLPEHSPAVIGVGNGYHSGYSNGAPNPEPAQITGN